MLLNQAVVIDFFVYCITLMRYRLGLGLVDLDLLLYAGLGLGFAGLVTSLVLSIL